MPVLDAVQPFVGIANENEFYSHHYLAEVFKGDIKTRLDAWETAETEHPGEEGHRAPFKRLQAWAQKWFGLRGQVQRARDETERWELFTQIQAGLLQALGYAAPPKLPAVHELMPGLPMPFWHLQLPRLAIIPAYQPGAENDDLLDHKLQSLHLGGQTVPPALQGETWADMLSDAVFGAEQPPRYVLLLGLDHWLLLDRYKWPNNRALRFDWPEILDRKDADTLKACAALLHKDSLAPGEGNSLLQSLDENAHKHAFGVSEDLKYALREAIELLGNEAARQLDEQASGSKKSVYSGQYKLDPAELSLECLRMVYRLLFMFYIEARPELGYVPIAKSEVYRKGYSLESLRDLADMPDPTAPHAREGHYFDATLRRLFKLVSQGCGLGPATQQLSDAVAGAKDVFVLAPLDSRLFDDSTLPLLSKVRFPNQVWQKVVRLMSLTRGQGKGRRSGRVSYQLLSINQLGAVYEALLSYRGFFAADDLYEVKPAPKKGRATATDTDSEGVDEDVAGDDVDGDAPEASKRRFSSAQDAEADKLENAWFVPSGRLSEYHEDERVFDVDDNRHRKLRLHPKGSFIYRLAGRDRQKSASYYTPQVLTQCLVKYALKELLNSDRVKRADDILTITVCEPAMGSAAFLNEAVNQLADAYLERKQAELGRRIPHDDYAQELQRVRMVLADRNVFGVDLNPVAVELAEVSLWLNAIYGEPTQDKQGNPLPVKPARVPWFGYQLFAGNSLIGARRQVYRATSVVKGAKPAWHDEPPRRVTAAEPRKSDEIWHFLLPDPGMADYADKDAKKLYPDDFKRLKKWRSTFNAPLSNYEVSRLQQLSIKVQELWDEHTKALARDRARTEDALDVWPHHKKHEERQTISRAQKEAIRRQGLLNEDGDLATPFRRLKLVMDYWCSLWFWPITGSANLPSREAWWLEVGAILEGNIVDMVSQTTLDLKLASDEQARVVIPDVQPTFEGFETQLPLSQAAEVPQLHDRFGQLRIGRLREHFPRVKIVEGIAARRRFMHWELCFADILVKRGGFDLFLGNPPWLKIEWQEAGVLGESNPLLAIRKYSSAALNEERAKVFRNFPQAQQLWIEELEETEGLQRFIGAVQNYSVLSGVAANLYKPFFPLALRLSSLKSVVAFLTQESLYDDPSGGAIRAEIYPRLIAHYQFENQKKLFPIGNTRRFGISVLRSIPAEIAFDYIGNLFAPSAIDECYREAVSECGGIKDEKGEWNLRGHPDRIAVIDTETLAALSNLFDNGVRAAEARLPVIHTKQLVKVLVRLSKYGTRLRSIRSEYSESFCLDENQSVQDGHIVRRPHGVNGFGSKPQDVILSGPQLGLANPLAQNPMRVFTSHRSYAGIDLQLVNVEYLPRSNFLWDDEFDADSRESLYWSRADRYRHAHRRSIDPSMERTVLGAIIPPRMAHIDSVFALSFKSIKRLVNFSATLSSLPIDYLIRSTGKSDLRSDLVDELPLLEVSPSISARYLALNCLTTHYATLWQEAFDLAFADQEWSRSDDFRLPSDFWFSLSSIWSEKCALRAEYARRMALIEIDVLVAQSLGMTLDELVLIYRIQFPVMQGYEKKTWYDSNGRIVFTSRNGSVGLNRKGGSKSPRVRIEEPTGRTVDGNFAWEDLWKEDACLVPDGTVVSEWVSDDTLPGGPRTVERRYVAPFARANREEDYRIAWAFFETQRAEEPAA